jgi:hypothetical protein
MAGWNAMTPYRDAHSLLHCPKCGEPLEAIRDGLAACFNCRGVWLGMAAVPLIETMPELAVRQAIRETERTELHRQAVETVLAAQQERATVALEIVRLERQLAGLRAQVRATEAALAAAPTRLK